MGMYLKLRVHAFDGHREKADSFSKLHSYRTRGRHITKGRRLTSVELSFGAAECRIVSFTKKHMRTLPE